MPRHIRVPTVVDTPTSVTLPVGSSLRDARRQLAIRTFASTNGDLPRAAKLLGITVAELRAELVVVLQETPEAGDVAESEPRRSGTPAAEAHRIGGPDALAHPCRREIGRRQCASRLECDGPAGRRDIGRAADWRGGGQRGGIPNGSAR